jgi:cyanophycinase
MPLTRPRHPWIVLVLLALAWSLPAGAWATPGPVVAIGGALRDDNAAVWRRMIELAGGARARFVVIGFASEDPAGAATRAAATLRRHGAQAEALASADSAPTAARVTGWMRQVEAASGVFFTGGAQGRITAAMAPGQPAAPLLQAIRALHQRGGVVAGTSAGAAIMSATMFVDPPATLDILRGGVDGPETLGPGLGFSGPGIFVDQHFLRRGRLARLLPAQVASGSMLGIGVDEDTAAVLHAGELQVVGSSGVLVADIAQASGGNAGTFALRGIDLYLLHDGDRLQLATRRMTPAAGREPLPLDAPRPPGDAPLRNRFFPDILAEGALPTALARAAQGSIGESALGLAFDPTPGTPRPRLGYEFRFTRSAATRAWDGAALSLAAVRLDVVPVQLADPLYRPWSDAETRCGPPCP